MSTDRRRTYLSDYLLGGSDMKLVFNKSLSVNKTTKYNFTPLGSNEVPFVYIRPGESSSTDIVTEANLTDVKLINKNPYVVNIYEVDRSTWEDYHCNIATIDFSVGTITRVDKGTIKSPSGIPTYGEDRLIDSGSASIVIYYITDARTE